MSPRRTPARAEAQRGAAAFDAFYRATYGEAWPALRAALVAPVRHVAWVPPWRGVPPAGAVPQGTLEDVWVPPPGGRLPPPDPEAPGWYLMDLASVLAARALDVRPGDQVLDLCAAPGGKTLVLAARLGDGSLVANDRSAARRRRLRRVLDLYLPPELRARVRVTGHDARRWGLHEPARYDRILLDAPCSTDRHVLADPAALARWSPARPRQLCTLQRAMLASALDALRPGGTLVYATCSLCPEENDGAIAWLHRKRPGRFEVLEPGGSRGSPTEFGCFLRPDRDGGSGPLYFARLRRRA